jgi:hypothetical protein
VLRAVTVKMREAKDAGKDVVTVAIGSKGNVFLNRIGASVVGHAIQLGDAPQLDKLVGPVKLMLDMFVAGKLDTVTLCYTRFINTMKQEPMTEALLPLSGERLEQTETEKRAYAWDYIYEPDAPAVIDELMTRYIEALVYQAVAENMASEQSARMVAMKAATDNAGNLIAELKLVYNKTRQAAITKELSRSSAACRGCLTNREEIKERNSSSPRQDRSVHRRVVDVEFPRDRMPRSTTPELKARPRRSKSAAARRRRRAHHRAGLVRRPAPRPVVHTGAPITVPVGKATLAASWTCWHTRSTSAARQPELTASIHRKRPATTS